MKKAINTLIEFFELSLIGAVIFVIVYLFIGQLLEVSGNSMEPNFHNKEQIIAEKLVTNVKRGDIVIFNDPTNPTDLIIKRVVGLPNETFMIKEGMVYINNEILKESYLAEGTITDLRYKKNLEEGEEYKIGEDSYILLGDNREESKDSRYWGALHKDSIIGKALLIYYPFENFRLIR